MGRLQMLQIVEVVTDGIFWTLRQVETMAVRACLRSRGRTIILGLRTKFGSGRSVSILQKERFLVVALAVAARRSASRLPSTCLHTGLYTGLHTRLYTGLHTRLHTRLYTGLYTGLHARLYTGLHAKLHTGRKAVGLHR